MGIDLYYMPPSAPCRSVIMVARELNIPLNLKVTNLQTGEHLTPEYLKLNPTHCIPTIVDHDNNELCLWESRAIMQYLVNQYAPGNGLYPSDPAKRAVVDRFLFFDAATLYPAQAAVVYPQLLHGTDPDPEKVQAYKDKLTLLDTLLAGNKFAAGDNLTLADLALLSTISTVACIDFDLSGYPNVTKWLHGLEAELPYHNEVNVENGVVPLKQWLAASKLNRPKKSPIFDPPSGIETLNENLIDCTFSFLQFF